MRTALDTPVKALDDDEKSFLSQVREHGWFRTRVFADDKGPGWSYTTGFFVNIGYPELIAFSMKNEIVHEVFWTLFEHGKAGQSLPVGRRTDTVFGNLPAYVFPVAKRFYADFLGWSRWFYQGDDFSCLQIVWPDRAAIFPWQDGFDPTFASDQPDLTENGWLAALTN